MTNTASPALLQGIVCRSQGSIYDVALLNSDTEQHWLCSLRGKLKREYQTTTSLIAVGDEVQFRAINDEQGVIETIDKRRSKLSRDNSQGRIVEQILAVNIDYAIIVMACHAPDYNPRRLDLQLTAALAGDLEPIIVLSKADLPQAEAAKQDIARYRLLGYPVIATSTQSGEGLAELEQLLIGKRSVLFGSSGVGKSSLINALDPSLQLRTQELRDKFQKGQHTTTSAELLRLQNGAWLIDTPGIRSFSLWDRSNESVEDQYAEFAEFAPQCRFGDCSHVHEPGCAVRKAVDEGKLDGERYEAYRRIVLRQESRRRNPAFAYARKREQRR